MKRKFNLTLTFALWLTMAQTAWATDPVTKTYAFSTRSLENNNSTLKMTDPDDNTSKTIITSASNYKFSNYGSDLKVGAGGQYTIYPNVSGKVTRVEFTHMGRWGSPYYPDPSQPVSYIGAFSMSITGMTCNGKNSLTGNGTSVGEGLSAYTNENASFTFVSTDAAGIEGSLSMTLGDYALMLIRSGCELKITYIPSPCHAVELCTFQHGNGSHEGKHHIREQYDQRKPRHHNAQCPRPIHRQHHHQRRRYELHADEDLQRVFLRSN